MLDGEGFTEQDSRTDLDQAHRKVKSGSQRAGLVAVRQGAKFPLGVVSFDLFVTADGALNWFLFWILRGNVNNVSCCRAK